MLITCFAFCFEMWNVIENCDFRFFFLQNNLCEFVLVIMLNISSFMFRLFDSNFFEMINAWQKRFIKFWRKRLIKHERHLIKFDKRRFIKFDEMYFIKFDKQHFIIFWQAIFHQIWWRYFIKLNENFVCFSLMSVSEWQAKVCE
jgi:hypothetical protein